MTEETDVQSVIHHKRTNAVDFQLIIGHTLAYSVGRRCCTTSRWNAGERR